MLTLTEGMGISTHGLNRVADYVGRLQAGGLNAAAAPVPRQLGAALALLDGQAGLGPAVGRIALDAAAEGARQAGLGACFVRGGSHLGALAPYLLLAAEQGFAAFVTTNTAPMIAPAGGLAPRVGNNPLGFALPHPDGAHVIHDIALSVVARSRVRAAARDGRPIPADWATDAEGHPTTDPAQAMRGLLRAIGGDKGATLAVMLDLFAAGLSGAAILSEVSSVLDAPERPQNLGHLFLLVDVTRLGPDAERRAMLARARAILADTPALDPSEPPRLPGARALAALAAARRDGLDLPEPLLAELRRLAG